ncbi:MAG TPA: glycosyltransferase family 4 protein [Sedimentisphaerales bacterium]|nr:glycosyltransferase family 4 protein [Sedimentisphaerales bacterium]
MTRILLVSLEGRAGGAETSLLLMAKHLSTQFLISAACPAESWLSRELASMGIDTYGLPEPPRFGYRSPLCSRYWLKTSWSLSKIALKTKPDIIHANSFYAGPAAAFAALVTRTKLLLHARDLTDFGFLSRFCSRFCKRLIAVSHTVKKALIEQGVNLDKIKVVYNGVDKTFFDRSDKNTDFFSQTNDCEKRLSVFAQVGQLVPWKNHIVFLKAASQVAARLPDARFVLVGDDLFGRDSIYKQNLLRYVEKSAIAEKVCFAGWQENMHETWGKIDCLVHTAYREPFGRVIIEAMAHKVPVIAVGSCGPSEIIQNGKTGVLVQVNDIEALSNAMLKVARDSRFANRIAGAGYEHAISNFTADKTAALIQEIYEDVLAL